MNNIQKENWEAQITLFHMLPVFSGSSCIETILLCCSTANVNLYWYPTYCRMLSYIRGKQK